MEIKKSLDEVANVYDDIKDIVESITYEYLKEINDVVSRLEGNLFELSNEDVRCAIVELSLKAYRLSDIKEKSALKAECAETVRKTAYADAFGATSGSVAARESEATKAITGEVLSEKVYCSVANTIKIKLDETHRVVDALKSVLVSRLSEEKLAQNQVM